MLAVTKATTKCDSLFLITKNNELPRAGGREVIIISYSLFHCFLQLATVEPRHP